jgi:hypothetical protein
VALNRVTLAWLAVAAVLLFLAVFLLARAIGGGDDAPAASAVEPVQTPRSSPTVAGVKPLGDVPDLEVEVVAPAPTAPVTPAPVPPSGGGGDPVLE